MPTAQTSPQPVKIPRHRSYTEGAIVRRLVGFATSPGWLAPDPEGAFGEGYGELRERQVKLAKRLAAEVDAHAALVRQFRTEDAAHQDAIRRAFEADAEPVDHRTPDRDAQLAGQEDRIWAAASLLADVVDEVILYFRAHEPELLSVARSFYARAQEREREAARLLEEARQETWRAVQLGRYIKRTADDLHPYRRQPAPVIGPVPQGANPKADAEAALGRRYHEKRDWHNAPAGAAA